MHAALSNVFPWLIPTFFNHDTVSWKKKKFLQLNDRFLLRKGASHFFIMAAYVDTFFDRIDLSCFRLKVPSKHPHRIPFSYINLHIHLKKNHYILILYWKIITICLSAIYHFKTISRFRYKVNFYWTIHFWRFCTPVPHLIYI